MSMILAKHVLTIYNKYMNQGEWTGGMPPVALEAWNRTVIKFGQWEDSTDRNAGNNGKNFIDKHISILIPKTAKTGGKKYIKPIQWAALAADQKVLSWSLNIGDIIACGEAPEITSAYTITTMRADFMTCAIQAVEDLTGQPIMPHFEILGV